MKRRFNPEQRGNSSKRPRQAGQQFDNAIWSRLGPVPRETDFTSDICPPNLNVWNQLPLPRSDLSEWSQLEIIPERFFTLEDKLVMSQRPYQDKNGEDYEKLSKDIWYHFIQTQQTSQTFKQKISLWCELNRVLGPQVGCTTHAFGSTLNGFGNNESDLDLCLFVVGAEASFYQKTKIDLDVLSAARNILRRNCSKFLSGNMELIPAKVPILKIYDTFGKIEVDISCNNPLSIRNSHLLFAYSQLDWRVRPLVLAIKKWAKNSNINDAKNQTLSSYTLSLMILHFLQAGVNPAVLPCLQADFPTIFGSGMSLESISFFAPLPNFQSANTMTLGELLTKFFLYYNDTFDFTRDVGSVRTGTCLTVNECHDHAKQHKIGPRQWEAYICMEEPFERTNSGRAILSRPKFDDILSAFKTAKDALQAGLTFKELLNE